MLFEQQQQPPQEQQLAIHGGCSESEAAGDTSNPSHDSCIVAPTLPTVALPRRGRREAVYDPKVKSLHGHMSYSAFHPSLGKQRHVWFIPLADLRGVCRSNCEIPWERVPYLSALEVCSRRGTIQIHIYLTLPYLTYPEFCIPRFRLSSAVLQESWRRACRT